MTRQDYECPLHGRFETTCYGLAPDETTCPVVVLDGKSGGWRICGNPSPWRPSAPPVHTAETRKRALLGYARDSNPW